MEKIETKIKIVTKGDEVSVFLNDAEFEPKRTHGSIHTRLNQMDDKIGELRRGREKTKVTVDSDIICVVIDDGVIKCNSCGGEWVIARRQCESRYCPHCGREIEEVR